MMSAKLIFFIFHSYEEAKRLRGISEQSFSIALIDKFLYLIDYSRFENRIIDQSNVNPVTLFVHLNGHLIKKLTKITV
jgi:hypothetical protein